MDALSLDRIWGFVAGIHWLVGLLWLGLAALTITLIVLMRTRWGQFHPLRKCVFLSLLAHVLLAGYATTVQIVVSHPLGRPGWPGGDAPLRISFVEGPADTQGPAGQSGDSGGMASKAGRGTGNAAKPWDNFMPDRVVQPEVAERDREKPEEPSALQRPVPSPASSLPTSRPLDPLPLAALAPPEAALKEAPESFEPVLSDRSAALAAGSTDRHEVAPLAPVPEPTPSEKPPTAIPTDSVARGSDLPAALLDQPVPLPRLAAEATVPEPTDPGPEAVEPAGVPSRSTAARLVAGERNLATPAADPAYAPGSSPRPSDLASSNAARVGGPGGSAAAGPSGGSGAGDGAPQLSGDGGGTGEVPDIYKLRTAPDRDRVAQGHGGTAETEAAVHAALKWLADNQSPDGRWNAKAHGAGRELLVMGRNRQGAGAQADTAMTGLTLLAFLAAGHTHREGDYREHVRQGLQYLLTVQAPDGNLAGGADVFAKMYCHAIAALSMSEAYAMTGDQRLRQPLVRAINYTVAAQDPSSGGWRYRPGDPGDTSQSGWQLMALKSAELAGLPTPVKTRNGLIRFLRSVSSGDHGGLASYRPGEQPSRAMTAEALACWQFLGMPREHPAGNEAGDYLLGEMPGEGHVNVYYWYYGTLAMYQLQGAHWQRWNEALRTALLASQQKTGPLAGSWDPDGIWGGYGGRIYSTALSALCLEVYYRFLPLYVNTAPSVASRPK